MNNLQLTQPEEMKTRAYVYGVEKLNGYNAWALFQACALGDLPKVKSLLAKDRRLVNAQHWYQFPIHKAVSGGHTEIVKLLIGIVPIAAARILRCETRSCSSAACWRT